MRKKCKVSYLGGLDCGQGTRAIDDGLELTFVTKCGGVKATLTLALKPQPLSRIFQLLP